MPERTSGPRRAALVIGGGMTGMLAAAVLSDHSDVTVIESDVLPRLPGPRRGLPQARHAHLLWSGGVRALEDLLPGITDQLVACGARLVPIMSGMVSKAPSGQWFRRFENAHHVNLVCSRDLLDSTIRTEVLRRPRVTVRERTELLGLEGDADRVTGVRIRGAEGAETLSADLVIDATGRASRAPVWLTDLGLPPVREKVVDAGVGYASRIYRAPAAAGEDFPIVNVQADPRRPPGRGGIILPIEEGRWLVTLSGSRGGQPSRDKGEFVAFARSLPHPVIGDLLAKAEPLTDVVTTRSTANKRRYFEKSPRWPAGFAVLGDAIAGYNPVYGHGLTAAAQSVLELRKVLARQGVRSPETARLVQRRAARPVGQAWDLAVGQDALYPGATDETPSRLERAAATFIDRAVDAGARNPHALRALLDVMSMQRPPARLLAPDMLFRVFLGRKQPLLDEPPLTEEERKAAGL
ncbi:FAD-dependent oxidoreductase [Streptomyces sp. NPDC002667]|uniref:FAD-dependent oxidoreductase n=1 Tax=Streptomyces sp. NPDC002667 TaxID=3364657 RepID=UPI00367BC458